MARICVFGDSIVWGSADPDGGWVARLNKTGRFGSDFYSPDDTRGVFASVFNCGINGDRTADVLARFEVEAKAREPDVIVLAVGINDVRHRYLDSGLDEATPLETFRSQYDQLIQMAKSLTADVFLVTPTNVEEGRPEHTYKNDNIKEFADAIQEFGRKHGLTVIDVFGLLTNEDLRVDGLHPGATGHDKLFQAIGPVVFQASSLQTSP